MRKLRVQRTPILAKQRGSLARHAWYVALVDALPTRLARSHTASYRAMNQRKRRLYDLARQDRQRFEALDRPTGRIPSVTDPIESQVLRIRNEFYCALAAG